MSSKQNQTEFDTGQDKKQAEQPSKVIESTQTSYATMAARIPARTADTISTTGATNANDLNVTSDQTMETKFELITVTRFPIFQERIFQLVNTILQDPKHREDPFAIKWRKAKNNRAHKMSSKSTLYMIQKILKVSDLRDYRNFLLQCPTIGNYITFRDNPRAKAGFEVAYHDDKERTSSTTKSPEASPAIIYHETKLAENPEVTTADKLKFATVNQESPHVTAIPQKLLMDEDGYTICFGTGLEFELLMTQVWFLMHTYSLTAPENNYSKIWLKWEEKGLISTSSFLDFKKITDIESLHQFYLFIKECEPVTTVIELQWDNKILFRSYAVSRTSSPTKSGSQVSSEDSSCDILTSVEEVGVNPTATITPMKIAAASQTVPTNLEFSAEEKLSTTLEYDEPIDDTDVVDYLYHTVDIRDGVPQGNKIVILHCLLFDIAMNWYMAKEYKPGTADPHKRFLNQWKKWLYAGLNRYTDFDHACRYMQVTAFEDYLKVIKECPDIAAKVQWIVKPEEIRYWITPDDSLSAMSSEINKFKEIRSEFTVFAAHFDTSIKDMQNKMKDVDFKLDNTIQMTKGLQKRFQDNLNQVTTESTAKIRNLAQSQYDEFRSQMDQLKQNMGDHSTSIWTRYRDDALTTITEVTETITRKAETIIDNAHNEMHGILEKVTEAFHDQVSQDQPTKMEIPMRNRDPDNNAAIKAPAVTETSRWSVSESDRVKLNQFVPTPNPYDTIVEPSTTAPPGAATTSHATVISEKSSSKRHPTISPKAPYEEQIQFPGPYGGFGYTTIGPDGLPYLQYDNILKRTSVQYTSQNDIVVFLSSVEACMRTIWIVS